MTGNKIFFFFNLLRGAVFIAGGVLFMTDYIERGHEKLFNIFGIILILYGAFRIYRTLFVQSRGNDNNL